MALAARDQALGRQLDQIFLQWHKKVRPVLPDHWSPWSPVLRKIGPSVRHEQRNATSKYQGKCLDYVWAGVNHRHSFQS